jgi:catechol-2,3-dioxygenase
LGGNLLGLDVAGQTESALGRPVEEETAMSFEIGHVHLKTTDPKKTAQFYVDNFGGTVIAEIPGRGMRVMLHGLQLNITTHVAEQTRKQNYGIEHIAVQTDDYAGTMATLKKNGVTVLEEHNNNGRHVCFLQAPDGAQMEVIEKV